MDGTSWANAASGSMVHVILLSAANGDRVYFSEGQYNNSYTITLPEGVSMYGGFTAQNPTWATRDAFEHPTVWTAPDTWMDPSAGIEGQLVDGFTIQDTVVSSVHTQTHSAVFRNGKVTGQICRWHGPVENTVCNNADMWAGTVSGCYVVGGYIIGDIVSDCTATGYISGNTSI